MTIREWIRDREIGGFPTFSVDDVRQTFPDYSEQVIKNELFRLSKQGILCPVCIKALCHNSSSVCSKKGWFLQYITLIN